MRFALSSFHTPNPSPDRRIQGAPRQTDFGTCDIRCSMFVNRNETRAGLGIAGAAAAGVVILLSAAGAIGADATDSDNDGFADAVERQLGTDPRDARSRPTLAEDAGKILACWPLASNAVDTIGGADGTLKNGARFRDQALVLDGRDAYVNFGPSLCATGGPRTAFGGMSYSVWIQPAGNRSLARLLGKFSAEDNQREYGAFFAADDRLWVFFSDNGSADYGHFILKVSRQPVLKKNQWLHLAVAWDASQGADGVACYTNGTPLRLWDVLSSDIASLHAGPADLTLGAYDIALRKHGRKETEIVNSPFQGAVSGLALCREALTPLEVRELFALGRGGDVAAYLDTDFDRDGLPDAWEREHFGDLRETGDGDADGDGVSNLDEYRAGTDPNDGSGDGDRDGLPDAWEREHGLDPGNPADAQADTDGDGLTNWQEFLLGTDPRRADTDGDGAGDGAEHNAGTDPLNAASFPAAISGTVSYGGGPFDPAQGGPIVVMATRLPGEWASRYWTTISAPGAYAISGVPNLTNYWVRAFRDGNGNGARDPGEPCGDCAENPLILTTNRAGVNVVLDDFDTDRDGLPDWWEMRWFGNLTAAAAGDPDGDGLTNAEEYRMGTDPRKATVFGPLGAREFGVATPWRGGAR